MRRNRSPHRSRGETAPDRKLKLGICAALLLGLGVSAAVTASTAFGPQDYQRGLGSSSWNRATFIRPEPHLTYLLRIENRGSEKQFRPIAAVAVKLNGEQVVHPRQFRRRRAVIERVVDLQEHNEIAVRLYGSVNSGLTLTVVGFVPVTVPSLSGLTLGEADTALESIGLSRDEVALHRSLTVPAGLVVGQFPAAGTLVRPGSWVSLSLADTAREATPVPDSWAGRWRFDVSFTDPSDGRLVAQDETETSLCAADPVGLVVIDQLAGRRGSPLSEGSFCSVIADDQVLDVYCHAEVVLGDACTADFKARLVGSISGDDLSASGDWSTVIPSECGALASAGGEDFAVTGVRFDADPETCDGLRPSLTQQLIRHPDLLAFGLNEEE